MARLLASLSGVAFAAHPLGPGAGPWEVESPESHGLQTEGLRIAKEDLFAQSGGITHRDCFVVIKDGALVFEEYSSNRYNVSRHDGWSMTKTLGALTAGWAATHGNLDIDADITATYGVSSPKGYPVTSRQIMSQSVSGSNGPGEAWAYDATGGQWINTMPKVVEAASGMKSSHIWQEKISTPLGLESLTWNNADSSWGSGSSGTCRDFARIGQLMLNQGSWKGLEKPIVSASYMHELSTPQTRYEPYQTYTNPCYGLLTWLATKPGDSRYPGNCAGLSLESEVNAMSSITHEALPMTAANELGFPPATPAGTFFAIGMFGQVTLVVPAHNAVVVSMGFALSGMNDVPVWIYNALCKGKVFEDCGSATQTVTV